MKHDQPLGIFDSGLGGLSVAREVRNRLPRERILYIADSAYCPYGGRPLEQILARSFAVAQALEDRGAKIIVVACNTATGAAVDYLREAFALPIVAIEPAVKPAARSTRTGRVAVLATPATLKTERFRRLLDNHGTEVDVIPIACPGFVELVESGELNGDRALASIRESLAPAMADVDRVVLGCTHYPFLRDAIQQVVGEDVEILDSGVAVARQVERVLTDNDLLRTSGEGSFTFYTTGDPATVRPVVTRLWEDALAVEHLDA